VGGVHPEEKEKEEDSEERRREVCGGWGKENMSVGRCERGRMNQTNVVAGERGEGRQEDRQGGNPETYNPKERGMREEESGM